MEHIPEEEEEEGQTDEQLKAEEEREIAKKIANIINQTLERMEPICKQITDVSPDHSSISLSIANLDF